jgi:hypothetical protein
MQALLPQNVVRRRAFWSQVPPLGIAGVSRHELIDIDECGLFLETCNRGEGKAFKGVRVREEGPYGHSQKWTLILAIDTAGFKHVRFSPDSGTTIPIFSQYILNLLARLPAHGPHRLFMWDNLAAHFSPMVVNAIYAAGHRIVPRPAYFPADGPKEFVFCQLECGLKDRLYHIQNTNDLIREVHHVIANIGGVDTLPLNNYE